MTSDDVQENPHAPPATPTASMENAVTIEREDAPVVAALPVIAAMPVHVQENPHAPPATPTASMDHAVTVEREDAPHASPPPTRLPAAVEPAAQELPARPRLRVSYWFEGDTLKMESVLMTDRRERVHSETVELMTGSTLEKVHALLLTVAATRAKLAGRVAAPPAPPAEPSRPSSSSEPPPADAGADESSSSDETEPEAAERKTSPDGLKPAQPEPTE